MESIQKIVSTIGNANTPNLEYNYNVYLFLSPDHTSSNISTTMTCRNIPLSLQRVKQIGSTNSKSNFSANLCMSNAIVLNLLNGKLARTCSNGMKEVEHVIEFCNGKRHFMKGNFRNKRKTSSRNTLTSCNSVHKTENIVFQHLQKENYSKRMPIRRMIRSKSGVRTKHLSSDKIEVKEEKYIRMRSERNKNMISDIKSSDSNSQQSREQLNMQSTSFSPASSSLTLERATPDSKKESYHRSSHSKKRKIEPSVKVLGTPPEIRFLHPKILNLHEKIKNLAFNGDVSEVMKVYALLENEPGYDTENDFIISMLMLAYVQSDKVANALQIFQQFYTLKSIGFTNGKKRVKMVLPLNILMQAFGKNKDIHSVLQVFKSIEEEGLQADTNSCIAVIRVFLNCDDLENALKCVREWFSSSLFPETLNDDRKVSINDVVYRELAHKFLQLGSHSEKENLQMIIDAARADLNEVGFQKLCNDILSDYSSSGRDSELEAAFESLFFSTLSEKSKRNELQPNLLTFFTLTSHFAQKKDVERVRKYLNIQLTDFPNIRPSKSYIRTIMKCLGDAKQYDLLRAVFNEFFSTSSRGDDIGEGEMYIPKIEASTDEYNILIRSLAMNGEVDRINTILKDMRRKGILMSPTTHVYVMLGQIKAGNLKKFLKLFKLRMTSPESSDFIHPDLESFLFLLHAIGSTGQLRVLLPVFATMKGFGIPLDANVHNRVLRGLSESSLDLAFQYFLSLYKESPHLKSLGYTSNGEISNFFEESMKLPSKGTLQPNLTNVEESNFEDGQEIQDNEEVLQSDVSWTQTNTNTLKNDKLGVTLEFQRVSPNTQTYIYAMYGFSLNGDYSICQDIVESYLQDGFVRDYVDRENLYNRLIGSHLVSGKYQEAYHLWLTLFEPKDSSFLLPPSDPIHRTLSMITSNPSSSLFKLSKATKAMPNATSYCYLQFIFKALHRPQYEKAIELYRRRESMNRIPKDDYSIFERFNRTTAF